MDITFACESCGQSIVIDEAAAGQLVDCPKCGKPLEVPYKSKPLTEEEPANLRTATAAPPSISPPTGDTKKCPFCAETIKAEAKICRFCGSDLVTAQPARKPAESTLLKDSRPRPKIQSLSTRPLSKSQILVVIAVIVVGFFAYNLWEAHQRAVAFFAAAKAILDEGNKLRSAVNAGVGYDSYVEHLAAFKAKLHDLPYVLVGSLPDRAQQFREQIEKAERNYDRARISWQYSDSDVARQESLLTAGFAVGKAGFQLSKLGVADFLFSDFR